MKKAFLQAINFLLFFCSLFFLSGCSERRERFQGKVGVSLIEHKNVTVECPLVFVERGENVRFTLRVQDGYTITDTSYPSFLLEPLGENRFELVLKGVSSPQRVKLFVQENDGTITYFANGGTVVGGGEYFSESCNLTNHKRANTSFGVENLVREGYALIGWNTKSDCSGETVGLGSRVTVPKEKTLNLYAIWKKETDENLFAFSTAGETAVLTGYHGNEAEIIVPASVNGKNVTHIGASAFQKIRAELLVLPRTLLSVAEGAFCDCEIETLQFYDDLTEISDGSFVECELKTVRINAVNLPVYASTNRHSFYADKVDLLILSLEGDKPRLVFEGDSGIWFNLNGQMVQKAYPEYTVVNMGLNGFFNGQVQLAVIEHYLKEGDYFIHCPVPNSYYQLLVRTKMTENMFTALELNYDLLSFVNVGGLTQFFDCYASYIQIKKQLSVGSYGDVCEQNWIDEYGCIPFYMPTVAGNVDQGDDAIIRKEDLDPDSIARLNEYYRSVKAKTGHNVIFSFGAVNYDGLSEEDRSIEHLDDFESFFRNAVKENASIVNHLKDVVWRGSMFYYTDFHLTTDAGAKYTEELIENVRGIIV